MLGVYIHIPFCERKCNYCAFSSFADFSQKTRYIDSLCQEIESFERKNEHIDTIYIGGGTPTVLEPFEMEKIFASLKKTFDIDKNSEITVECNPNSLSREKLLCYKALGVNRLSIGVQSLNDEQLKFAGRLHNSQQALDSIRLAREIGFENISVDLLIGLNNSNEDEFIKNLKILLDEKIKHISTYMLQVEDKTPLKSLIDQNPDLMPDDDNMVEILLKTADFLKKNGFLHYEVSNFALKGYESKHNYKYWSGEEYVGFGLSAHSYLNGERFANASNFEDYFSRKIASREVLTSAQKIEEHIMLGLRCSLGIDVEFIKSLGYDIQKNSNFQEFLKRGILFEKGDKICLNEDFYQVNNFVIVSLMP